jgi:hypothetical protein
MGESADRLDRLVVRESSPDGGITATQTNRNQITLEFRRGGVSAALTILAAVTGLLAGIASTVVHKVLALGGARYPRAARPHPRDLGGAEPCADLS